MKQLKHLIGKRYEHGTIDEIDAWAKAKGYSINIIPTDVDNIDIDPKRLNVWTDLNTGEIKRFTVG
jgi:hypothetical protein